MACKNSYNAERESITGRLSFCVLDAAGYCDTRRLSASDNIISELRSSFFSAVISYQVESRCSDSLFCYRNKLAIDEIKRVKNDISKPQEYIKYKSYIKVRYSEVVFR